MTKQEKCSISQKNRIVIHKGDSEKRIYPEELSIYINSGWKKGASEKHKQNNSLQHVGKAPWNKGLTKELHPSIQSTASKLSELNKGSIPWNKGLTYESDERIRALVDKGKVTKAENFKNGKFPQYTEESRLAKNKKISEANKGKHCGPRKPTPLDVRQKISAARMGHTVSEETKKKISESRTGKKLSAEKLQIFLTKQYLTKKKNNSFNKSKSEQQLYESLIQENRNKTIYRQYKDERYPFYCDFYIVEDDLFIELNTHWTHGSRPYDPKDEFCQQQLAEWQEKAKTSKFYQAAIDTWTIRDVKKAQCAKENNLNYKVIY